MPGRNKIRVYGRKVEKFKMIGIKSERERERERERKSRERRKKERERERERETLIRKRKSCPFDAQKSLI